MMKVVEDRGSEHDNRICLTMTDQNVMRDTVRECSGSKSKSGGKWKRLHRAKQEEVRQRKQDNKENQEVRNQKRGFKSAEGLQTIGNEGQEKRMKVQDDQKGFYNVQVRVANLEWPQMI